MKKDIILCGVGGQGILSIATIIGEAATETGINLKQAEVHGMSQRGGDVQSNLRLSTDVIYSDPYRRVGQTSSSQWSRWKHCAICLISQRMVWW